MPERGAELEQIAETVLAGLPSGVEGDVRVREEGWTTMRFANGHVHQPHVDRRRSISLRAALGGRLATATTTDATEEGIRRLVREAVALAAVAPIDRRIGAFQNGARPRPVAFSAPTLSIRPEAVGRLARESLRAAGEGPPGARISGAVHAGGLTLAVANTAGRSVSGTRTASQGSVLVERPDEATSVSGWAEGAHWDAGRLDGARLGREALSRMPGSPPKRSAAGRHRVLLSGPAVADLLGFFARLGFPALGEEEGWSCLKGRRGRRVFGRDFDLHDDGRSALGLPTAFDEEGTPKRRTPLIEGGVVGDPVTDLVTSGHLGRPLSGHALPPESPWGEWGPMPTALLAGAGDASFEDLVRSVRTGLLVTRFHYVRVVHPSRGLITGMTRDGTYRIERGEVAGPVRNLRFTDSVVDALRHVVAWGRDRRRYSDERGLPSVTCPPLVTDRFRFTSSTLF